MPEAILCAVVIAALCVVGRSLRSPAAERALRRGWAVLLASIFVAAFWVALRPADFDPARSLPLQLCHWAAAPAFVALWSDGEAARRWSFPLAYFWCLGLSALAFFVPVLHEGPDSPWYWRFWGMHLTLVGSGGYVVFVRGYRPGPGDVRRALWATAAYAAIVLPIDVCNGWHYGYLGARALPGPWPDLWPSWPWRLAPQGLGVVLWFRALGTLGQRIRP